MRSINIIILLLVTLNLSSCAWLTPKRVEPVQSAPFVRAGKIVNIKPLKKGGTILVLPFKPSVNVEANDELDRVVLMLIRGIIDVFEETEINLNIVFNEPDQQADFIIDGYITEFSKTSKLKRWISGQNKIRLGVRGKLMDQKTNYTLVVFDDTRDAGKKEADYRKLARIMGQDIGRFILQDLNKE